MSFVLLSMLPVPSSLIFQDGGRSTGLDLLNSSRVHLLFRVPWLNPRWWLCQTWVMSSFHCKMDSSSTCKSPGETIRYFPKHSQWLHTVCDLLSYKQQPSSDPYRLSQPTNTLWAGRGQVVKRVWWSAGLAVINNVVCCLIHPLPRICTRLPLTPLTHVRADTSNSSSEPDEVTQKLLSATEATVKKKIENLARSVWNVPKFTDKQNSPLVD